MLLQKRYVAAPQSVRNACLEPQIRCGYYRPRRGVVAGLFRHSACGALAGCGPYGFAPGSPIAESVEFFFYDTAKILLLLVALIYAIAWARAGLNVERVRDYLSGKAKGVGYFLGSAFGAVTPFCSCSSIPLFLGFTTASIPMGITMSFLITSPLINELAVVLLWGLLGWKITVAYVVVGMIAGIIGGCLMDAIKAERWLHPFILEAMANMAPAQAEEAKSAGAVPVCSPRITLRQRHDFAWSETSTIFRRVWKWVIIGVGLARPCTALCRRTGLPSILAPGSGGRCRFPSCWASLCIPA